MNGGTGALLRIARREAWRAKARTALVALLVALPVAGAGAVDVVWRATVLEPRDVVQVELAGAQARVEVVAGGPVTQEPDARPHYDDAGTLPERHGSVGEQLAAVASALPPGDRLIPSPRWHVGEGPSFDIAHGLVIWELPYASEPALSGLVDQVSGRAPRGPDEIAISTAVADRTGLDIGGTLLLPADRPGDRRPVRVVGVIRVGFENRQNTVIGGQGVIPPSLKGAPSPYRDRAEAYGWVVGPAPLDSPQMNALNGVGAVVLSRAVMLREAKPLRGQAPVSSWASNYPDQAVIVAVAVGLVLLQIVLMAGPALAVGARRQQRTLALLGATGGTRRQMRGLVLANGLVAGIVAGLAGVALGTGLGVAVVGWARDHRDLVAPRLDVRITDLLILLATGVLTTVGASLVPARIAARMDVVGALAGRRPAARRQRTRTALGLLFVASGLAGAVVAAARHEPAPTVVGIAATEIGFVLLVPAIVALAARLTGAAAPTLRISLRDADRQRTRTAPAVAAVMAAVGAAVAAMTFAATQSDRIVAWEQAPSSPELVSVDDDLPPGARGRPDPTDPGQVVPAFGAARIGARLAESVPVQGTATTYRAVPAVVHGNVIGETQLVGLTAPGFPCAGQATETEYLADECKDIGQRDVVVLPHGTLIGDADALRVATGADTVALTDAARALAAGRIIVSRPSLIWPDGSVHLQVTVYDGESDKSVRTLVRPGYLWRGNPAIADPVVSPATVQAAGITLAPATLIARLSRAPGDTEKLRAEAAVRRDGDQDLMLIWGDTPTTPSLLLWAILAAAVAVALIGTFSAVGLAAAEARPDLSTLAAVGASPGLRRRFAAAQAVTVAGLGSAVGLIAGLATGYVFARLLMHPMGSWGDVLVDTEGGRWGRTWGLHVPWLPVLAFVLGLPVITAAVMAALTRSRLPVVRRLGQ